MPLYVKARETRKALLGADHPDTLESMNNLAMGYRDAGISTWPCRFRGHAQAQESQARPRPPRHAHQHEQPGPGLPGRRQARPGPAAARGDAQAQKAKLGPDHPDTLSSMNNLASGYQAAGKLDQALPLYEETLKLERPSSAPTTPTRSPA